MATAQIVVLAINIIRFGLAFRLFALRPRQAVRLLVPKGASHDASFEALVAGLPFLGGFNLAFATLSGVTLALFSRHAPTWPIFFASAVAHATQLASNVPLARRGGREGGAPWDVLQGPMAFIFAVDGLCTLLNGVVNVWLLL